jgi:hypothetical protein
MNDHELPGPAALERGRTGARHRPGLAERPGADAGLDERGGAALHPGRGTRGVLVASRQALWRKGESSGNTQLLKELRLDCDGDTLLLKVEQRGGIACHTGRAHCFYRRFDGADWETVEAVLRDPEEIYGGQLRDILAALDAVLQHGAARVRRAPTSPACTTRV